MDKNGIFALINGNQVCHLATSEDNVPHVRGMLVYRADDNGIQRHNFPHRKVQGSVQAVVRKSASGVLF